MPRTEHDMTTIEGRIAATCQWFAFGPPARRYDTEEPDAVLLGDELLDWALAAAVSLDGLFCGDPKGAVMGFRERQLEERPFREALRQFDATEKTLLLDALKAHQEQGVPLEEALEGWKTAVVEHRASGRPLS